MRLCFAVLVFCLVQRRRLHLTVHLRRRVTRLQVREVTVLRVGAFLQQVLQQTVAQLAFFPLQLERTRLLALHAPQLLLLQPSALLQLLQSHELRPLLLHLLLSESLQTQTHIRRS